MAIHHEPENDVSTTPGSGMTAKDYAAMFRHTVQRMRANGVTNVVFVMAYMNVEKWNNSSWWYDLYPGNDVVDWVGVDSYVNAQPGGFHNGDFNYLMNRTTDKAKFPGWYNWAVTKNKPIMVAEWAVYECKTTCDPNEKAKLHATVVEQLKGMPAIKAHGRVRHRRPTSRAWTCASTRRRRRSPRSRRSPPTRSSRSRSR